jgi:AraC-like DNA-binding protein
VIAWRLTSFFWRFEAEMRGLPEAESSAHSERLIADPGSINFVRLPALPGVEVMDVRAMSRKWAYFHESYSFCVASRVEGPGAVPWKYRMRTHWMNVDRVQLMEPGEFHTNLTVAPPADFRVLMLSPELVARVARALGCERLQPVHLRFADLGDGPVRKVLQKLTSAIADERDPERAECGIRALLCSLSEHSCLETAIPDKPRKASRKLALHARDLIHERWNQFVPLDEMSGDLGVSIPTLERAFGEAFGTTPKQYQNHLRLMRGKVLLAAPDHSIATIAKLCGFNDRKYFARLFRRAFAQNPQTYRDAARSR